MPREYPQRALLTLAGLPPTFDDSSNVVLRYACRNCQPAATRKVVVKLTPTPESVNWMM